MLSNRLSIHLSCLLFGFLHHLFQSVPGLSDRCYHNALTGPIDELYIAHREIPRIHHIQTISQSKHNFHESLSQNSQGGIFSTSAPRFHKFENVAVHSPCEGCPLNPFVFDLLLTKRLCICKFVGQGPSNQGGVITTVHSWSTHLELHLVIARPLPGRVRIEANCDSATQGMHPI